MILGGCDQKMHGGDVNEERRRVDDGGTRFDSHRVQENGERTQRH